MGRRTTRVAPAERAPRSRAGRPRSAPRARRGRGSGGGRRRRAAGGGALKCMCSWATVTVPSGASAAASRLKLGRVPITTPPRIVRRRRSSAQVGPQAAPRVGVVLGVHEQAGEPRRAGPRARALVVDRGDLDAVGEREERPLAAPHEAHDLDVAAARGQRSARLMVARTVPPMPQACRSRMRTSRPSRLARSPRAQRPPAAARRGARATASGPSSRRASAGVGPPRASSTPARRSPPAPSAPRRCSRPCSRAGGGARRPGRRGTRSAVVAVGDAVEVGAERGSPCARPRAAGSRRRAGRPGARARRGRGSARSARSVTRAGATTSMASPRRRANRYAGSSASVGTAPSTCSVAPSTRTRVTSACGASGLASTVSAPPFGRATVKR